MSITSFRKFPGPEVGHANRKVDFLAERIDHDPPSRRSLSFYLQVYIMNDVPSLNENLSLFRYSTDYLKQNEIDRFKLNMI